MQMTWTKQKVVGLKWEDNMGFLSKLIGGGIGEAAKGIGNVVDQFMETPDEKRAAELVIKKLNQRPNEVQAEINKIEAGHRSIFVAGWRPFLGWICGFGLGYQFVLRPLLQMVLVYVVPSAGFIALVSIDTGQLMTLVLAMLGLGGLRTYEKRSNLTS